LKLAVIGSGLMGAAAAKYLAARKEVNTVQLVDRDETRLNQLTRTLKSKKLIPLSLDASDTASISEAIKGFDAALIALPHRAAYAADLAAIKAGVNAVDLVFEDAQMKLHSKCLKAGVSLIPGCGVGPGIVQILAREAARHLTTVDEIHILVGGLPQVPRPPLNYRIVFSFEQVLEMYTRKNVRVIRDGKVRTTTALSELEPVSFPEPYGDMEAFLTDGLATLLYTMKGRVRVMDEKTVRYPGHAQQIKTLIETGLASTRPIRINGLNISPRTFLSETLGPKLQLGKEKDVTLLRVIVLGTKNDSNVKYEYEMVDKYSDREQATSMARTTAYTAAIAAMMLAKHQITDKGILPPESCFAGKTFKKLFQMLAEKNVRVSRTVTARTRSISEPRHPASDK
jgi:lysine 6-dehydrogenase